MKKPSNVEISSALKDAGYPLLSEAYKKGLVKGVKPIEATDRSCFDRVFQVVRALVPGLKVDNDHR